jgi:hypothetical protein
MEKICRNVRLGGMVLSSFILVATLFGVLRPAMADTAHDAQQLVEKARLAFEAFVADKDMGPPLKALLKKGRGVLIYPQVLKGVRFWGLWR